MSDYISRNVAVKVLTSVALNVPESKRRAVAKCINQIELLPAADVELVPFFRMKQWFEAHKQRWIPCSERLPETNGKDASYLVYVPSFGAVDIADYHPDVDEWTFMGLPVTVTHWMPMPEPPEEI